MAGALVGGAFLCATLQVLLDRMVSRDFIDLFRGHKLSNALLGKLNRKLLAVNALLNDAEDKQITNPAAKAWFDKLQETVYDAEDILDEISTNALRAKLEAESPSSSNQVQNFFSTFVNPFNEGIKFKIEEIIERLEDFAREKDVLGLKKGVKGKPSQRLPTTSFVDELGVYGRDKDKEEIMKLVLPDDVIDNEIRVITIVGMGGVGKTTLAQLVYNDHKVEEYFDLKAWVWVSEESDVFRVTKKILEAVILETSDIKDLNLLQVQLGKKLAGKKILLVLDDVWNEDYIAWDVLRAPFGVWAPGSKIIVTTRNDGVASVMRTVPTHYLGQLSDADCWSVFAKHAFRNGNSSVFPKMEIIGRRIAEKCRGLPLAAKTLGGILRCESNVEEWKNILNSEIWKLPNDRSNILPALRLSYYHLPTNLKPCFAYCSIFPKDYEFEKENLVLLWMAEGFLQQPNCTKRMEEIGDDYFRELISRSFFQQSSRKKSCFVLHDLMNDLAQYASGEFCFWLQDDKLRKIPEKARHFSYSMGMYDAYKKIEACCEAKGLRTFLPLKLGLSYGTLYLTKKVPNDLLPMLRCLRVLSLSYYQSIIELPDSVGNMKHLHYLDLSNTPIRRLPDSICNLYNLQTLILSSCYALTDLPMQLWKLINLRHLNISRTKLKEMPKGISRLKTIQTLSTFVVGKHDGSRINELRDLNCLRGTLSIVGLEHVVHGMDALGANLKGKEHLDELLLKWSSQTHNSGEERKVLEKLQPHTNLKKLTIDRYGGTKFPNWLGDPLFSNIVFLCLSNCNYCLFLPPLGQLHSLKDLCVRDIDKVERVGREFYGHDCLSSYKPFRSLETLRFEWMSNWKEWLCFGGEDGEFPCLRELYIRYCPSLTGGLPNHLPSLTKLEIFHCQKLVASLPTAPIIRDLRLEECDEAVLRNVVHCTSLTSLYMRDISDMRSVPDGRITTLSTLVELQHLSSLEVLEIGRIQELKELPQGLRGLSSLKRLSVRQCPSVSSFPETGLPPMLESLTIEQCDALESLPEGLVDGNTCLRDLYISDCYSLRSFLEGGLPTTLKTLLINYCDKFEFLPPEEIMRTMCPCKSLESISIFSSCESLKSFPLGIFTNLQHLRFSNCANLESLSILAGLPCEDFTSLCCLEICECPNLISFPDGGLPTPNLTSFLVSDCKNLESLPKQMHALTALRDLKIEDCPKLVSFPEGSLPPNLKELTIRDCDRLLADRMEWGLQDLNSLVRFRVERCAQVKSFPEEWLLPITLTTLEIRGLSNLIMLEGKGLGHLSFLEELEIYRCPKLRCMPSEGLPASLSLLIIEGCPLLKQKCQREKGEDWPRIAHIPCIHFDDQVIL